MSYTALDSTFAYKGLLTWQQLDGLGDNDKVFNDLLTGIADLGNDFRFDNAKAIAGEVAAGGSYKDLLQLDASDVCQLGQAGTEVRAPADPTDVLGVATKQYVDGVQMFQTQAIASVSSGAGGSLATILNLTATTRGMIHSIWTVMATAATMRYKITLDGVVVIDDTSIGVAGADFAVLVANGFIEDTNSTDDALAARLVNLRFNSTCLIEAASSSTASTTKVLYSKIP